MKTAIFLLALIIVLSGCVKQPEQVVCTEDARECPDGSFVIRDPNNNCEFYPCPEITTVDVPTPTGEKLKAIECDATDRPEACTLEYVPVCGWFNENIICAKYPCAMEYGNKCMACADENVGYYTEGECPDVSDGKTV
ncbi:hypothetical protein J4227_04660 [Candidatus Woesearchaeota archaeon]|nr:hypothetical protein [Candidatus Woesearchaeota archaeon]